MELQLLRKLLLEIMLQLQKEMPSNIVEGWRKNYISV